MFDFLKIEKRIVKKTVEIYPSFEVRDTQDLMIRGGDFYAFWNERTGMWCKDEFELIKMIDIEIRTYAKDYEAKHVDTDYRCLYMRDSDSGSIDRWHKYCQKQMRDNYTELDENLVFSNTAVSRENYATKTLDYPLVEGPHDAWDELVGFLYEPEERHKIEWAIGSIVSGDSKNLQKFFVFYGSSGTGKSTILNIIQLMFNGYWAAFEAKALGQNGNQFAMESLASNPLIAIQHDGDLSRIEDNTKLNSIVSHEVMTMNEKYKKAYPIRPNSLLLLGTNRPVKITDSKSGLLRRLVDISPTGNKLPIKRYNTLMSRIKFELSGIAWHCLEVYKEDPLFYDPYVPVRMLDVSNHFYNYVSEKALLFSEQEYVTLKQAWDLYKEYCEDAGFNNRLNKMLFQDELKSYFKEFRERYYDSTAGIQVRNAYLGFKENKFARILGVEEEIETVKIVSDGLKFDCTKSILDEVFAGCKAQYANAEGFPTRKWMDVSTKLSDINTSRLHYVRPPQNHIVIDLDLKTKDGKKSFKKNVEAASKFPPTYAELSKSGEGIHLHYTYDGDVTKLSRIWSEDIEIKVFTGNSSLRRMVTKCNDLPIRSISGLPLKGEVKMLDFDGVKSERMLRNMILKALRKEVHANTKPNVDYIKMVLDQAYASGMKYDVSDMRNDILAFCINSTNQSDACLKMYHQMKFSSEEEPEGTDVTAGNDEEFYFYDVEVFSNLFVVCYKKKDHDCVKMINPSPAEIEGLLKKKLIGFNCRRYDNHIMYARSMGYSNAQLYSLSQQIINTKKGETSNAFFGSAYNLSYTDIYDFASAGNKKSLKKLEIEMGIHHQELGLKWDQPVPEELWDTVADYCCNDVIATEKAFYYLESDWTARQILAEIAGMSVNDTTNALSTKIIFGGNKNPQVEFMYRNLADPVNKLSDEAYAFLSTTFPEMMAEPHGGAHSLLPYFPGYKFDAGKSTYRGEEVGEGGYVYAEPGMYGLIALLDIASMHPHSAMAECLFGPRYTKIFRDIVYGRVHIKHENWDEVEKLFDGKLVPFIQKVKNGLMKSKDLANALKTAINSVYGLTAARFMNAFRDARNIDNIVAKRGALFMVDLKHAVQEKGFTVAHIKTDSIKIPDATPEIIRFVMDFGKRYGYTFEHEATYDRMCLVNNAVYIARYKNDDGSLGDWTATGTQFAVPYVFKSLFSHEELNFKDTCETKTVSTALYLDMNENLPEGEHDYRFVGKAGLFCPINRGCGGGELVAERGDKYDSVTGAKDYRWLESEVVESLGKFSDIDKDYYVSLVNDAIDSISRYGDFEWFVSDDPYIPDKATSSFMNPPEDEGVPWE